MIKLIMDTNFAVIPFQFKVDVYAELSRMIDEPYEICFLNFCIEEIKKLEFGDAALKLMEQKGVKFIDAERNGSVDDSIIDFAKKEGCIIATQDKELKKKALKENISVIFLRQKKYLKMSG